MPSARLPYAPLIFAVLACDAPANGIDVRDFARAPEFAHAALSPGGGKVSYVSQMDGRQVVFVRMRDSGPGQPTLSVAPPDERIRWCGWADDRFVLCGTIVTTRQRHALIERSRLYSIDAQSRRVRELNARHEQGQRDQVIDLMPATPATVLMQLDMDGRGFPAVFELDVRSGEIRQRVRSHPPVRSWLGDGRGQVRLGLGYESGLASLFAPIGETWRNVRTQSLEDPEAIGPLAFGEEGAELFVLKHHRGRAALFRWNPLDDSPPSLLFADPMFDVAGPVVLHPSNRSLLAVRYLAEQPSVHFFSAEERDLVAWLDRELPHVANEITSRSSDGKWLLVVSSSDTNPPSLYVANREREQITLLGHQFPALEGRPLATVEPLMYSARDGQRVPAYLTRGTVMRAGAQGRSAATGPSVGGAGSPAVVLPHGGPEMRDVRKFDPLVQMLAARGYVVLQMNFRGSLGYGAGFAAAGAKQWGGVIHNDITDGTRWLVAEGIADPERICILGVSFGGYAALLGAARESQWYACAASIGGASDLLALYGFTQRLPDAALWRERLGSDPRALWQMSPVALAQRVETPVMLIHGRRDAVVPLSQARRLARTLRVHDKIVELLEPADCDHDLTAESCRVEVFEAVDRFLLNGLSAH